MDAHVGTQRSVTGNPPIIDLEDAIRCKTLNPPLDVLRIERVTIPRTKFVNAKFLNPLLAHIASFLQEVRIDNSRQRACRKTPKSNAPSVPSAFSDYIIAFDPVG